MSLKTAFIQVTSYLMVWDTETPQRNTKICSQQEESTDAPRFLIGLHPEKLIVSENVFNTHNLQNSIA